MSDHPLTGLFSSRSLVRLLAQFLMNPDRSFYQQELVRATGIPLRPVQLALAKLERADLISKRRDGRQVYYRAVTTHPVFKDLQSLFARSFGLGDVLREALSPLASSIRLAFVYGSIALGEERAASDVDLLIVGSIRRGEVAAALGEVESRLGREVNLSLYTPERFADATGSGDPFIARVMDSTKVWLVGDADELERMAG